MKTIKVRKSYKPRFEKFGSVNRNNLKLALRSQRTRTGAFKTGRVKAHPKKRS